MKKVVVATVSDRKNGNSHYGARVFAELAVSAGVEVVKLPLEDADIEMYWDSRDETAPKYPKDDFMQCLNTMLDGDAFVVFSPIHWAYLPSKMKLFIDRISEAMRRPECHFTERMFGKIWSYVLVSGENPESYEDSFWRLHERICNFDFVKAVPIRGPWFVAYEPSELKNRKEEMEKRLGKFLESLLRMK